ncbi:MAG: aminoglycoside phosphotransferase family protein [Gracilimonas sp.]|uniref:phosphotransferase enzyme family protein n=1 Tax=Gracilimonas sp. TaxID=1974203 RepID=UPI0037527834|nr:aminoglycoside phosphotransferase family protein [Gracilimonas sp.]
MNSDQNIKEVLSNYPISLELVEVIPVKTGLIHTSYKVTEAQEASYLLQKINTSVFRDVETLMENIALVTNILKNAFRGSSYESLELLKTNNGQLFYKNECAAWRIYHFKEHLTGYDVPNNKEMVREAGKAFSVFAQALSETDPEKLSVTIPNFHSMQKRYGQLQHALENTTAEISHIDPLSKQIEEFKQLLLPLEYAMDSEEIPLRITHNDSKFNNLLFDEAGKARCVVDLDTVMPGIIHFDVGDCLRTLTPSAPEDEPELANIKLRKGFHSAFLEGFVENESGWLTKNEIKFLPYSAPYMALIMGIRFLTDYLQGNIYYSSDHPEHNLIRARCQVEVTKQFLDQIPLNSDPTRFFK